MIRALTVAVVALVAVACRAHPGNPDAGPDAGTDAGESPVALDTFEWVKSFPASQPQTSFIRALESDATGEVIAGALQGTVSFGPTTLTAPSSNGNAFVAKLDLNGNVLWAKVASGGASVFEAVAVSANGDIFLTGTELGDGSNFDFTFDGATLQGVAGFYVRLQADGTERSVQPVNATNGADPCSLAISGNELLIAGTINGTGDFTYETIDCATQPGCVFLVGLRIDTGAIDFAMAAPGAPPRTGTAPLFHAVSLLTDANGNIDLAIGGLFNAVTVQDNEMVVLSYAASPGAPLWSKSFSMPTGPGPRVNGFAMDGSGALYVGGTDATGLTLGSTTLGASGDYLAKLDPSSGNVQSVTEPGTDRPYDVASVSAHDGAYTFGGGTAPANTLPAGETAMVITTYGGTAGATTIYAGATLRARAEAIKATAAGTFIAGEGGPGDFGKLQTSDDGFFVAKLK